MGVGILAGEVSRGTDGCANMYTLSGDEHEKGEGVIERGGNVVWSYPETQRTASFESLSI